MKGAGRSDDLGPPFFPGPVLDIFAKIVLEAVILGAFRRVESLLYICMEVKLLEARVF